MFNQLKPKGLLKTNSMFFVYTFKMRHKWKTSGQGFSTDEYCYQVEVWFSQHLSTDK